MTSIVYKTSCFTSGSLSGEEGHHLWQSRCSRSDIHMGDHFIVDESTVDNSAKCSCSDNAAKQVHIT